MRITLVEAKRGIDPVPIKFGTTEEWNSLGDAVAATEQRLRDQGNEWTPTAREGVVMLDVHDPPTETLLCVIDTDRCEEIWKMPIDDAVKHILASVTGGIMEPGAENTLKVTAATVTPEHVREMAKRVPLVALTFNSMLDLERALGSKEEVVMFLIGLATENQKPIAVNTPTPKGSTTQMIAPEGWSEERLAGWVGTNKAALEAAFGDVAGPPRKPNRAERRKRDK